MEVLVKTDEREGLVSFLGGGITLWCMNYIYTGKLIGVNDTCVKLSDAMIVYETGKLSDSSWKDAQDLIGDCHYIQCSAIESYGPAKT